MHIQNFLLGASLSALLAMTATANAAENAVQKEGNAIEAKGNAQEKKAVREKKAAEKTAGSAAAKEDKGEQMQKEAKSLKKNDSTAAQESQGARQTHPEGVRRNGQVRRESREGRHRDRQEVEPERASNIRR
jgi:hypothetical protein